MTLTVPKYRARPVVAVEDAGRENLFEERSIPNMVSLVKRNTSIILLLHSCPGTQCSRDFRTREAMSPFSGIFLGKGVSYGSFGLEDIATGR